jgi:hypothetical protein
MFGTKNHFITLGVAVLISSFLFSSCAKETEENLLLNAKNKMEEARKLEGEN